MRSRRSRLRQKSLSLFDESDLALLRVEPTGKPGGSRVLPAQVEAQTREGVVSEVVGLMDQVVERGNMRSALERVERNKGAAGVDGMGTQQLRAYLREHWPSLKRSLLDGSYRPQAVKRVEIPKPDGGKRMLGIPSVLDRLIQQA